MRRAVLLVIDGLRADCVRPELTPALAALAGRCARFAGHRAVFPTATRVNSASIATGCLPAAHGLLGNTVALDEGDGLRPVSTGRADFRERLRRATGATLHRPTLAERLAAHGGARIYSNASPGAAHLQDPDGHGHLFHRAGCHGPGLRPLADPEIAAIGADREGDARLSARFCAALEHPGATRLFVLWLCEPDHSQHALELGSAAHRELLAACDRRLAEVHEAVERMRRRGEEVLFLCASDHGQETVCGIVSLEEHLVAAGLKSEPGSGDVVIASSGMSALVYLAPEARARAGAIRRQLEGQPWCQRVLEGPALGEHGLPDAGVPALAVVMAKRPGANRHGVPGLGFIAADPAMAASDRVGHGQHGGLGAYESAPLLLVEGGGFAPGVRRAPSASIDLAPTILRHLGLPADGMDGVALATDGRECDAVAPRD